MIYQFDEERNGQVIAELVDPKATKDFYKGAEPVQCVMIYDTDFFLPNQRSSFSSIGHSGTSQRAVQDQQVPAAV
jgi:hypothetical protein